MNTKSPNELIDEAMMDTVREMMVEHCRSFLGIDPETLTAQPYPTDSRLGAMPGFTTNAEATAWLRENLPYMTALVTTATHACTIIEGALTTGRIDARRAADLCSRIGRLSTVIVGAADLMGRHTPTRAAVVEGLRRRLESMDNDGHLKRAMTEVAEAHGRTPEQLHAELMGQTPSASAAPASSPALDDTPPEPGQPLN